MRKQQVVERADSIDAKTSGEAEGEEPEDLADIDDPAGIEEMEAGEDDVDLDVDAIDGEDDVDDESDFEADEADGADEEDAKDAEPAAATDTPARTKTANEGGEAAESEDDDDLTDEVEASLDVILAERLRGDDPEDEEQEEEEDDAPNQLATVIPVRQPDEFLCQSCFLLKPPGQLADPDHQLCRDCA
ncbi:MAG: hypothetical protein ACRDZ8_16720 [Acidimicrobiales bacterium]